MTRADTGLCRACGRHLRIQLRSLHRLVLWCAACRHYDGGSKDAVVELGPEDGAEESYRAGVVRSATAPLRLCDSTA